MHTHARTHTNMHTHIHMHTHTHTHTKGQADMVQIGPCAGLRRASLVLSGSSGAVFFDVCPVLSRVQTHRVQTGICFLKTSKKQAQNRGPSPAACAAYANLTFWAYVSWRQKSACSRPVSPAASPSHDSRSTQSQDPPCVCHATLYAYAPMAESQRQPASRAARPVGQPANTGANEQASRQRHQPEPASRQPIINKRKTMKT